MEEREEFVFVVFNLGVDCGGVEIFREVGIGREFMDVYVGSGFVEDNSVMDEVVSGMFEVVVGVVVVG